MRVARDHEATTKGQAVAKAEYPCDVWETGIGVDMVSQKMTADE